MPRSTDAHDSRPVIQQGAHEYEHKPLWSNCSVHGLAHDSVDLLMATPQTVRVTDDQTAYEDRGCREKGPCSNDPPGYCLGSHHAPLIHALLIQDECSLRSCLLECLIVYLMNAARVSTSRSSWTINGIRCPGGDG